MLGEFIFQGDVYEVKTTLDTIRPQDHRIKFQSLKEAQFFFGRVASDPFTREELLEVAQWLRPTTCRPRANCPAPTEEALLEELCLQVFNGDLVLVILKANREDITSVINLQTCCTDVIKEINGIITKGNILSVILVVLPVFKAFFYPPGHSQYGSLASTAVSIGTDDWTLLARTLQAVPEISRVSAAKVAGIHALKHDGNQNLKQFWERLSETFYQN